MNAAAEPIGFGTKLFQGFVEGHAALKGCIRLGGHLRGIAGGNGVAGIGRNKQVGNQHIGLAVFEGFTNQPVGSGLGVQEVFDGLLPVVLGLGHLVGQRIHFTVVGVLHFQFVVDVQRQVGLQRLLAVALGGVFVEGI